MAAKPHFILLPLMAQGHMIPMIDAAKLLASHGVIITIITTPLNAGRIRPTIDRAVETGLQIRVTQLRFPCAEAGLPEGCENFDVLPSLDAGSKFFKALGMLEEPVEKLFGEIQPPPTCIVSDICLPWTMNVAEKFGVPRLVFSVTGCFSLLCIYKILVSNILGDIASDTEYFVVPGLPDQIEMTKAQLPGTANPMSAGLKDVSDQIVKAEQAAYGLVVNSFEEMESEYVQNYKQVTGKKVWCIGPVSLCNKREPDMAERGKKASIDEIDCLKWLDSQSPNSVIYACLGSLFCLSTSQLIELGLGLESSNRPFIWVIGFVSGELEKWLSEERFEERNRGRGLIIRGWAPQVLILSHPSVGGFLTHCGWNSVLEGVAAGVPMITWPLYAEQFCNEKLILQVLRIGVSVGVESPVVFGEEENVGLLMKREEIAAAVRRLMGGEGAGEMRKRAGELQGKAKRTIEEGGSSHINMAMLIKDMVEQSSN